MTTILFVDHTGKTARVKHLIEKIDSAKQHTLYLLQKPNELQGYDTKNNTWIAHPATPDIQLTFIHFSDKRIFEESDLKNQACKIIYYSSGAIHIPPANPNAVNLNFSWRPGDCPLNQTQFQDIVAWAEGHLDKPFDNIDISERDFLLSMYLLGKVYLTSHNGANNELKTQLDNENLWTVILTKDIKLKDESQLPSLAQLRASIDKQQRPEPILLQHLLNETGRWLQK